MICHYTSTTLSNLQYNKVSETDSISYLSSIKHIYGSNRETAHTNFVFQSNSNFLYHFYHIQ